MKYKSKNRQGTQLGCGAKCSRSAKTNLQQLAPSAAGTLPPRFLPTGTVAQSGNRNGGDVVQIYFWEVGRYPLLERHEEAALIRQARAGNKAARERLITSHLRHVVKIARTFEGFGLPLLDLISEGNIGLMKAVDRFKSERGSSLAVYAAFWIKQRIRLALANHSRTIRVPVHIHGKLFQARRAATQLHNILGREPSEEEVSQAMRIPSTRLRKWQDAGRSTVSLDQPLNGESDFPIGGLIADVNARTPHESIVDAQTLEILTQCVANLDPRLKCVLEWRFGLNGQRERTLQQVGAQLGVSRERIRQIQNAALAALREEVSSREFIQLSA